MTRFGKMIRYDDGSGGGGKSVSATNDTRPHTALKRKTVHRGAFDPTRENPTVVPVATPGNYTLYDPNTPTLIHIRGQGD